MPDFFNKKDHLNMLINSIKEHVKISNVKSFLLFLQPNDFIHPHTENKANRIAVGNYLNRSICYLG